MLIDNIINFFGMEKERISIDERFSYLKIIYKSTVVNVPKVKDMEDILNNISSRDSIKFYVDCDDNSIAKYSKGSNINDFINDFQNSVDDEDDINYVVTIEVEKVIYEGNVSIYSINNFINYLEGLSLKELLYNFNDTIKKYKHFYFRTNEDVRLNTNTIYFLGEHAQIDILPDRRSLIKEKRIINCSYLNETEYDFVADDFIIIKKSENTKLNDIFLKLAIMYSLVGICDVSIIDGNYVTYIINGYHRIESKFFFDKDLSENLQEYIEIYKWIYSDLNNSSCTDKIGIARNVISASVRENNLLCCNNGLFKSICSAHSIYLKENVKQYLEVKAKVSEFNFDLMQKNEFIVKRNWKISF